MSLRVIGAGFGRTGTLSVYTALNQLGLRCYHMIEILENKDNTSHLDFWCHVANGKPGQQFDWEQVFAGYAATVDNPGCTVWRELVDAYPNAKVLLTVHPRDAEAWYQSTMETVYFTELKWQFKVLAWVVPFARKLGSMSRKLVWQRSHQGTMANREQAIARYYQHIEDVKAAIPPERLLLYSVEQGWQPLCDFLGVPVPATPFPNVNDRAEFKRRIAQMCSGAYVILGVGAIIAAGLIYGLATLLS